MRVEGLVVGRCGSGASLQFVHSSLVMNQHKFATPITIVADQDPAFQVYPDPVPDLDPVV